MDERNLFSSDWQSTFDMKKENSKNGANISKQKRMERKEHFVKNNVAINDIGKQASINDIVTLLNNHIKK